MLVIDLEMLEGIIYLEYDLRTFNSGLEDILCERMFGRFKGGTGRSNFCCKMDGHVLGDASTGAAISI